MTNRIKELENTLPIIKSKLDSLINQLASYRNEINEEGELNISLEITRLKKSIKPTILNIKDEIKNEVQKERDELWIKNIKGNANFTKGDVEKILKSIEDSQTYKESK